MPHPICLTAVNSICFMLAISLSACSKHGSFDSSLFIGEWQSSRLTTPLHLLNNGEWEIKTSEGAVLQYGVWELKGRHFVWSVQIAGDIERDVNEVMSAMPTRFELKEADGRVTTFDRLDVSR